MKKQQIFSLEFIITDFTIGISLDPMIAISYLVVLAGMQLMVLTRMRADLARLPRVELMVLAWKQLVR